MQIIICHIMYYHYILSLLNSFILVFNVFSYLIYFFISIFSYFIYIFYIILFYFISLVYRVKRFPVIHSITHLPIICVRRRGMRYNFCVRDE